MLSIADLKITVIELSNRTSALDQCVKDKPIVLKLNNNFLNFNFAKNLSNT